MNQLSIDQEPTKKTNTLFILSFFFVVGVSALSGWNCILVGMDYFNLQFVDMWAEFYSYPKLLCYECFRCDAAKAKQLCVPTNKNCFIINHAFNIDSIVTNSSQTVTEQ